MNRHEQKTPTKVTATNLSEHRTGGEKPFYFFERAANKKQGSTLEWEANREPKPPKETKTRQHPQTDNNPSKCRINMDFGKENADHPKPKFYPRPHTHTHTHTKKQQKANNKKNRHRKRRPNPPRSPKTTKHDQLRRDEKRHGYRERDIYIFAVGSITWPS